MSEIILNEDQKYASDQIKSGKNIFLTGRAGTGKSVVARECTDDSTIVCSSTGVSALSVGGETLHRVFGLPLGLVTLKEQNVIPKRVTELFESDDISKILMDEISMTRPDHLDLINFYLKAVKGSNKPFGGVQVIPTGDFYQLEAIVGNNEKRHFFEQYDTNFAFGAACWNFETVELKKVMRNGNNVQVNMLNAIREKDPDLWKKAIKGVNAITRPLDEAEKEDNIYLCCYNSDASLINEERINDHQGKEIYKYSRAEGFKPSEIPVPEKLFLKEGCRVMIKANNLESGYINGDRGILIGESANGNLLVQLDRDGSEVTVEKFTWEKTEYKKNDEGKLEKSVVASYTQYPVILAYAISVHKCVSENTLLNTPEGEVEIKDIQVGDFVLSKNGFKKVTNKWFSGEKNSLTISTKSGSSVTCSPDHKILVADINSEPHWVTADQVKTGDYLVKTVEKNSESEWIRKSFVFDKVENVIVSEPCLMYDIEVEDDHCFFANGLLVHNCQGLTLENCILDTGSGCFSHGQLYVALSRVKDLTRMALANKILPRDLIVKDEVKQFYARTQKKRS